MADDRQAGFLHLRLRKNEDGQFFDLLMPDLPGEWSRALIDKADGERLSFLGSATVIWLMVDGRAFANPETRNYAVYRAEMLVERLAVVLPNPRPRIILVPSWRDIGDFPAASYDQIRSEGIAILVLVCFALFVACGTVGNNADRGNGRAALRLAGFWIAGDTANEDNKICHGYSPEFCIRDHPGCEPDRRSGQQALAPQILRGTP